MHIHHLCFSDCHIPTSRIAAMDSPTIGPAPRMRGSHDAFLMESGLYSGGPHFAASSGQTNTWVITNALYSCAWCVTVFQMQVGRNLRAPGSISYDQDPYKVTTKQPVRHRVQRHMPHGLGASIAMAGVTPSFILPPDPWVAQQLAGQSYASCSMSPVAALRLSQCQ
jgi:hypothetical protein